MKWVAGPLRVGCREIRRRLNVRWAPYASRPRAKRYLGQGQLPWIAYSLRDVLQLVPSSPANAYLGIEVRSLKPPKFPLKRPYRLIGPLIYPRNFQADRQSVPMQVQVQGRFDHYFQHSQL